MNPIALNLLTKERVCVFSVVTAEGMPHGAVVHYSQTTDPVKIFIQTYPTLKTKAIQDNGGSAKASVVVGLAEADSIELQMHGEVRIVTDLEEMQNVYKVHYAKHPKSEKYKTPDTIFLEFTPTWWRYTDFNTEPETIIES